MTPFGMFLFGLIAGGLAVLFRMSQIWEASLVMTVLAALFIYLRHRPDSMIMVIMADYINTARAKGLPPVRIRRTRISR